MSNLEPPDYEAAKQRLLEIYRDDLTGYVRALQNLDEDWRKRSTPANVIPLPAVLRVR